MSAILKQDAQPNFNTSDSYKKVAILFNLMNTFLSIIWKKMFIFKKHQRTPSQAEISEFKALTKLDALQSLQKELNKLLLTGPQNEADVLKIYIYFLF